VTLRLDSSAGYPVIVVDDEMDAFPGGFPPVVWPYGFTAKVEGTVGRIIATDGQQFQTGSEIELVGTVIDDRFFVCRVNQTDYF
jgi:hypothetical protein